MASSPDPIAIYAAVVSTVVFVWDVVKWRRQERLYLVGGASANMMLVPKMDEKKYISMKIDNRGHAPCEITHMVIIAYDNWWKMLRGKMFFSAIVPEPMSKWTQKHLPYRLEHGESYWGLCQQTDELEKWSREKRLYVGVCHNMGKRPFKVRVCTIESIKVK